jgi:hypothetical protein
MCVPVKTSTPHKKSIMFLDREAARESERERESARARAKTRKMERNKGG